MEERTFECKKCGYTQEIEVSYELTMVGGSPVAFLKCVCGRCSYTWVENTSDHVEETNEE